MDDLSELKHSLQNLSGNKFEYFVSSVWSSMGWSTKITQHSRDYGVDVIATKSGIYSQKVVIQAKCYSDGNKVGRPAIQQYSTLEDQVPDTDTVIVVTSSSFTSDATKLAKKLNVKTVNGDELAEFALRHAPEELFGSIEDQNKAMGQTDQIPIRQSTTESVSTENLSPSEQDLAEIYSGYYSRYEKDLKGQLKKDRRLIFQLAKNKQFKQRNYITRNKTHYINIAPEVPKLLKRVKLTAEKYGWEVKNIGSELSNGLGIHRAKNKKMYSVVLDTGNTFNEFNAERQAKITSLLFSSVIDEEVSGTEVKEATGVYTRSSPATKIE